MWFFSLLCAATNAGDTAIFVLAKKCPGFDLWLCFLSPDASNGKYVAFRVRAFGRARAAVMPVREYGRMSQPTRRASVVFKATAPFAS